MILDSSALVAIIRHERDELPLSLLIDRAPVSRVSAATVLETSVVLHSDRHKDLDDFLAAGDVQIVPFDGDQAVVARAAYAQYGKRSGSKAHLNLGDCFSYALAKVTGEPLLFKGDDFTHTDIEPAFVPDPN